MVTNVIWPVISSILSTFIIGGITALYKSIRATHVRFDAIETHLRKQDLKIAKIEGKVGG